MLQNVSSMLETRAYRGQAYFLDLSLNCWAQAISG